MEDQNYMYIFTELCEDSLQNWIRKEGAKASENIKFHYAYQILAGLCHIHHESNSSEKCRIYHASRYQT